MTAEEIVVELPKAVLAWYGFRPGTRALLMAAESDKEKALAELLASRGVEVSLGRIEEYDKSDCETCAEQFDYVVVMAALELCEHPEEVLAKLKRQLGEHGRLLLGMNNRLGIQYFAGDRDPYTGRNFDGIENYNSFTELDRRQLKGRCYSRHEISDMLDEAGLAPHFYAVLPGLNEAQLVYADGYYFEEELSVRYFPRYNCNTSIFMDERKLFNDLLDNDLFYNMANAFLVECSVDGEYDSTVHATMSYDRGRERSLITRIYRYGEELEVSKSPVYPEGKEQLQALISNHEFLRQRGVRVIEDAYEDGRVVMPYVKLPTVVKALKEIGKRSSEDFLKLIDAMFSVILKSSDVADAANERVLNMAAGRDLGVILKRGFIDMVPINCFFDEQAKDPEQAFVYYDQEFYYENLPAKAVMYRAINFFYDGSDKEFELAVPMRLVTEKYDLEADKDIWINLAGEFVGKLRNMKEMIPYTASKECDARVLHTNRLKVNYSAEEYQRMFVDIFCGLNKPTASGKAKKLLLFGSGVFATKFVYQFQEDVNIYGIIDNNEKRWGQSIENIPIYGPDILRDMEADEAHIIICIRNYIGIANQLNSLGIRGYHVYDPGNEYPVGDEFAKRVARANATAANTSDSESDSSDIAKAKPYNIGYVAGVFDLFHVGHLNLLRRAKEMCNYLIVGVVSDEAVRINKKVDPYIPFTERVEIVRACRYVDEAVKLPLNNAGTRDMFRRYHFDVQFSGSDYEHDVGWLNEKRYLEEHGSTMVFFPYTQSTSSTKLRQAITK